MVFRMTTSCDWNGKDGTRCDGEWGGRTACSTRGRRKVTKTEKTRHPDGPTDEDRGGTFPSERKRRQHRVANTYHTTAEIKMPSQLLSKWWNACKYAPNCGGSATDEFNRGHVRSGGGGRPGGGFSFHGTGGEEWTASGRYGTPTNRVNKEAWLPRTTFDS